MHTRTGSLLTSGLLFAASLAAAEPPAHEREGPAKSVEADTFVGRMMVFDRNRDGKLTRDEVTDVRLRHLFDQADANKDGVVTKEELARFGREVPAAGGRGTTGGFGPWGLGIPGPILLRMIQDRLSLTDAQKKQVATLQKEVDARMRDQLDRVLFGGPRQPGQAFPPLPPGPGTITDAQKKQLLELPGQLDAMIQAQLEKILTDEQTKQLRELRPGPGRRRHPTAGEGAPGRLQ